MDGASATEGANGNSVYFYRSLFCNVGRKCLVTDCLPGRSCESEKIEF